MNGGDDEQIPGEPLWGPPRGKPYDWAKVRGWPNKIDWEEVVFVVLAIFAVIAAFWILLSIGE